MSIASPHSLGGDGQPLIDYDLRRFYGDVTATAIDLNGPLRIAGGKPWYDVTHPKYGAAGTGAGDDTAGITRATEAARLAGGGVVLMPPGTYPVNMAAHPTFASTFTALTVGAGVILKGCGRNATKIFLIAGQTHGEDIDGNAGIVTNYAALDENGGAEDLTIDGNNVNQTHTHFGHYLLQCRAWELARVRVLNANGTGSSGPTENFLFQSAGDVDTRYIDCEAVRTAGNSSAGFSSQGSTGAKYMGCTARGMSASHGFTCNNARNLMYANCWSYLNSTQKGFNCEVSFNVLYVNCTAGGRTPTALASGGFIAQNTPLGNGGAGFTVLGPSDGIQLVNCDSDNNGTAGLTIGGLTAPGSVKVIGGNYRDNGTFGINFLDAASAQNTRISDGPLVTGNATAAYTIAAVGNLASVLGQVTGGLVPAVGGSPATITNPIGFDVWVYVVTPGTGTVSAIAKDGAALTNLPALGVNAISYPIRWPAGGTITITWATAAPSLLMFLD